ncbi:glutaredoxin family protein [Methyloprofundus sp.]|uniref:glutaredoxin family protein n=1 Tax=Methyloprofundus sp. TaxID=2020875 RepID=UPI003D0CCD6A
MNKLLLLSTSACHLCEQAEELLQQIDIAYQKIDIAEQEQWQERYAIKIPVLLNTHEQRELCWPFSIDDIQAFVKIAS